ncbi:hypothetical protein AAGS40_18495 [Paraburkholderia sp. PREW-6R]|uniref:hypothetical protein n=1 Tax=Paraburkholderia sp. PREW-6R TaxID=3141544 RepID=UPI0031F57C89
MTKRRRFMGCLTALGGSYLLGGCGGGGGSDDDASQGANHRPTAHASASLASASGTAVPPATSITDSAGSVWTVQQAAVYENGVKLSMTYNVSLLLWYGGSLYCRGTDGQFYAWNGSIWNICNDPRLGGTSADGTTLPASPYIIDQTGAIWTLVDDVIYRNGATVGVNYNVSLVLWLGGKIWHVGTGGQYYVNVDGRNVAAQWLPCSDPHTPVSFDPGMFYGMNGHFDYTYTPTQVVAFMKAMRCSTYRVGCTDAPAQIQAVVQLAQAFRAAGLTLFVLINQGVYDASGNVFASETAAYARGFACAQTIARAMMPYGVALYECGNELTREDATIMNPSYSGTLAMDFNNANWPAMRGVMRGMIDGVKSVQPTAKCGVNFCVADVGASDALWEGMQPDGSGGHPPLRWDMTTWHNYDAYGDIFSIGSDGQGPAFDLPAYCKARYGVPFMITEWNTGPDQTEAFRATYITTQLGKFYAARKSANIQSVMYYVLDSGNSTYGIMVNGVPLSLPYAAFTSFTGSHADT